MKTVVKFLLALGIALSIYSGYLTCCKKYGPSVLFSSGKVESYVGLAAYKKHAGSVIFLSGGGKNSLDDDYLEAENTRNLYLAGAICALVFGGVFYYANRGAGAPDSQPGE